MLPRAWVSLCRPCQACQTSSATFCTRQTLAAPDADQTYFWSDAFHPTPRGHQLLSDRALELLRPVARKPG